MLTAASGVTYKKFCTYSKEQLFFIVSSSKKGGSFYQHCSATGCQSRSSASQ